MILGVWHHKYKFFKNNKLTQRKGNQFFVDKWTLHSQAHFIHFQKL